MRRLEEVSLQPMPPHASLPPDANGPLGLPSYEEAISRSGQHDAPPPPYPGYVHTHVLACCICAWQRNNMFFFFSVSAHKPEPFDNRLCRTFISSNCTVLDHQKMVHFWNNFSIFFNTGNFTMCFPNGLSLSTDILIFFNLYLPQCRLWLDLLIMLTDVMSTSDLWPVCCFCRCEYEEIIIVFKMQQKMCHWEQQL